MSFSVPTLDLEVWRRTEPGTAPPRQRLRALRVLVDAGIDAGVGMAPILPGISDDPAQLAEVVRAAREAGATGLWCNVLHLQPGTREHFLENLARDWPALLPRYEALYRGNVRRAPRDRADQGAGGGAARRARDRRPPGAPARAAARAGAAGARHLAGSALTRRPFQHVHTRHAARRRLSSRHHPD